MIINIIQHKSGCFKKLNIKRFSSEVFNTPTVSSIKTSLLWLYARGRGFFRESTVTPPSQLPSERSLVVLSDVSRAPPIGRQTYTFPSTRACIFLTINSGIRSLCDPILHARSSVHPTPCSPTHTQRNIPPPPPGHVNISADTYSFPPRLSRFKCTTEAFQEPIDPAAQSAGMYIRLRTSHECE
jgi:hypothetical protein